MFPFFRPDPAWQSRRRGEPQAPPPTSPSSSGNSSSDSPRRSSSTVRLLSSNASPSNNSSSNFRDEGHSNEQGLETTLYYDHLGSGSSADSSIYDEETALNGGAGRIISSSDTDDTETETNQPNNSNKDASKQTTDENNNSSSMITAAQLEWLSNEHVRGTTVATGVPVVDRPSTPVAGNRTPPQHPQQPQAPRSPSEAPPNFKVIAPNEVEDQTIINSDLAEAWFARRREQRMQQMLIYNPPPQPSPPGGAGQIPIMDPRTGGFARGPMSASAPAHAHSHFAPPQPPMHGQNVSTFQPQHRPMMLGGPVDVDSGSAVEGQPPTATAQAIMLRNPFESGGGNNDATPLHPHFVPAAHTHPVDDSISVVSRPNSLSSFPSATTDMTPVVSNVTFPQAPPKYAGSSYAASSSSANYNLPSVPDHPLDQNAYPMATGDEREGASSSHGGAPKGFCACCGSSNGDRSSCKGFMDIRTYHGKLALLLVTILLLAIATMVVSATMTFQTNKNAGRDGGADQQLGEGPTAPSAVPSSSPLEAPTISPAPSTSASPTTPPTTPPFTHPPTASPSGTPSLVPTYSPSKRVSGAPSEAPTTSAPTSSPSASPSGGPTAGPSQRPTPKPSESPSASPVTTAPTTSTPTKEPTASPTDDLDDYVLPQVTTLYGPEQGSFFGTSCALSRDGHVLVVGAPEHNNRKGQVQVMLATSQDQWEIVSVLNGTLPEENFGYDVALSEDGNILAVGASGKNGTVYTFSFSPNQNTYLPFANTIPGELSGASFGHSVALSLDGFRLVAGAPYGSSAALFDGEVRVYEVIGERWVQMGESLSGGLNIDWLGSSVDISGDGNMVVAAAPRNRSFKGYVRTWTWNGQEWTQTGLDMTNDITPRYSGDRFGHSIALSEGDDGKPRVAIGVPWKTVDGQSQVGVVLVYAFNGTQWESMGSPVTQNPATPRTQIGNAVDLDGGILSVGIPGLDGVGAVALYRFLNGDWEDREELIEGAAEGDDFGVSLSSRRDPSTDGFALVVGALQDGNDGAGYVASYVKQ